MFYLCVTIVADVLGVLLLAHAQGFERPGYFIGGLLAMVAAFAAFSFATKTMSPAIANAVWSGMSLVLVAMAGKAFMGQPISAAQYVFLVLILAGVVGMQLLDRA